MQGDSLNILIGGEAGQGLVTMGQLISKVLVREGYSLIASQDYMSRIRGGHNYFAVRVSDRKLHAPREKIHLLVSLDENTYHLHRQELDDEHVVLSQQRFEHEDGDVVSPPIAEMAEPMFQNMAMCGAAGALIGINRELLAKSVYELFARKKIEYAEKNLEAFNRAWDWVARLDEREFLRLPRPPRDQRRLFLSAHDSLALGALSAGLKFYSFYPMTPSTNIANNLARQQAPMPIVVEQAEDEIAAINLALGASYAGVPAMVGTSGGGFALMVEGVSLAGMTETPIVIIVGQRPGPATGLPTRTEQGDLEFVLHSGHGEFPRAIFAPGSPEQAFDAARRSLFLAEESQGPVFILSDQYMADTYREVDPFEFDDLAQVQPGADPTTVPAEYKRYQLTDSGVSPRLIPARSEKLVVVDSDEHYEDGHITEEAGVRQAMVEKRQRKMDLIRARVLEPGRGGPEDPEVLLVCWGSTLGPVREAAERLNAGGVKAGWIHFAQVWPLVDRHFLPALQAVRRVVMVEGNNLGQFARLIRRETGFEIREKILRYDGRPITPEFILRGLNGEGG